MKTFGAHSLFLAPEYFGNISPLSTAIVGITSGVFIMSWNITTFILHSDRMLHKALFVQCEESLQEDIHAPSVPFSGSFQASREA